MDAAAILGVANVVALGRPDGELEDTADFRKDLVRQIRIVKPDVVLTAEPYRRNMQCTATIASPGRWRWTPCFPTPRDHLHFGDLFANEGIEPHKTAAIMFWGSENPNAFVDIAADFDAKLDAVLAHTTQTGRRTRDEIRAFISARAQEAAAQGNASTEGRRQRPGPGRSFPTGYVPNLKLAPASQPGVRERLQNPAPGSLSIACRSSGTGGAPQDNAVSWNRRSV